MATTHQLFSESFTYQGSMAPKSSAHDRHHLPFPAARRQDFTARRWASTDAKHDFDFDFDFNFNFNLPKSDPCFAAHADRILSKALLRPLHSPSTAPKGRWPASSNYNTWPRLGTRADPTSSCASGVDLASRNWKLKLHLLGNCVKSSKKTLQRYLSYLLPSYKKAKSLRLISSKSTRSCKDSAAGSGAPKAGSNSFSNMQWCRSNADISIYDAILHCKKSIGLQSD